jgi:O-antigen ligase
LASQLLHEYLPSLDKVIRGIFLIVGLVNILETLNPMGIYETLFAFFTHHTMEQFIRMDSIRIIGTMMNPNDNGVFLTCFIAYFMSSYYYSKNKWNLVLVMLGLVLVVLSQSRTSLIAVLAMGVPFLLTFRITRTMIFSIVGSAIVVVATMYLLQMNYMMELLSKNPLEISAFQARFRDWGYVIEVWNEHKIWGVGPFADTFTAAGYFDPDSEYLYILASRGVVGLVCYLIILAYPILLFWKKRNEVNHALLAVLLSVAFMLIGITNFSLLNVRIGVVYAILIGIPFSFLLFKSESSKLNLAIPSIGSLFSKKQ